MDEQSQALVTMFETMANILDVLGDNAHRAQAYRRASGNLSALDEPLVQVWKEGRLKDIPGIGDILAKKIAEYFTTGTLAAYQKLSAQVPLELLTILEIPGVGPRRVELFWKQLGITSMDELESAAKAGQLRQLRGIGARTEQMLLEGIRAWRRQQAGRIPLGVAWPLIQDVRRALRDVPGVFHAEPAGSLRRMQETVGDVDLLVAAQDTESVITSFCALPVVDAVVSSHTAHTIISTMDGIQIGLRVLHPERWGSGLHYFTGSQAHNAQIQALAAQQALSLSEYGFHSERGADIVCAGEEAVYATLGLPWIPPELREDRGEIAAAQAGRLPHLVKRSDILGDFQCHTLRSNGECSMAEMAEAAEAVGLRYIVAADHTHGVECGAGISLDDVDMFLTDVARVNAYYNGSLRVLAGAEVNIDADGHLDWPDDVLARLDFVVASVHTDLGLPQTQMTHRIVTAMRNPYIDLIGHPTGRLLGRRAAVALDMAVLFQAALAEEVALEINAWPQRFDLNDVHIRQAVEAGVMLAISSDAHDREGFAVLDFGVALARRGWAEPANLLNTRPAQEILQRREARIARKRRA